MGQIKNIRLHIVTDIKLVMPILQINANVNQSDFDDVFLKEMTSTLSKIVGKPEAYIMVVVNGNKQMSFGGSTQPCALVTLESIGCINEKKNIEYAAAIFQQLSAKGIESSRTYINFHNLERDKVAWNGKLFSQ